MKLEDRLLKRIRSQRGNVVLRAELSDLGSAAQLSRVLKALQTKGVLVRIGTGVYARTRRSSITGTVVPAGSLESLATEALVKLGVSPAPGRAAMEYNAGKTTQLPGAFVVNTGARRITRRIEVGGRRVFYENDFRN